jgi:hypothetical protein
VRAYSAAHFEYSESITLPWADATAKLQSEYTGGTDGRAYAVTIHCEIHGVADSLDDAQRRLTPVLGNTLSVVALAANASVADPLVLAVHGLDLTEPQPFLGHQTPQGWDWFPTGRRLINAEATHALIASLILNQDSGLLRQAIESYRQSLAHWTPEQRLLAGEFLSIAAETLSRYLVETRAAARGMSPKNLAKLVKAKDVDSLRWQILVQDIFARDEEAVTAMREASNGFEHGYMAADQVRGLFEPILERSMGHVRRALIQASGVDAEAQRRMLAPEYKEPRGLVPAIWVVTGELSRADTSKPAPAVDTVRIELGWTRPKPIAIKRESGEVDISFPWTVQ